MNANVNPSSRITGRKQKAENTKHKRKQGRKKQGKTRKTTAFLYSKTSFPSIHPFIFHQKLFKTKTKIRKL